MKGKHDAPPCATCPYHLGIIKTFVCPCPQCIAGRFQILKDFLRQSGGGFKSK